MQELHRAARVAVLHKEQSATRGEFAGHAGLPLELRQFGAAQRVGGLVMRGEYDRELQASVRGAVPFVYQRFGDFHLRLEGDLDIL